MYKILLVGCGGFIGATCRYLLTIAAQHIVGPTLFPIATLSVNALGCLMVGCVAGFAESHHLLSTHLRLVVLIGFLGGFTTYSAFAYDVFRTMQDGHTSAALFYLFVHTVVCFFAIYLGIIFARLVLS